MSWSSHITTVCAKASKSLGYLRRNLHNEPTEIRKLAYLTFVSSQLEFASSVWSPHQAYLIRTIESIQNRAARFIFRNYDRHASITQIKLDISIQPSETRRSIAPLCLLHKCINSATPSPLPLETPIRMSARLHNQFSFKEIFGKTRYFNSSALPRATVE